MSFPSSFRSSLRWLSWIRGLAVGVSVTALLGPCPMPAAELLTRLDADPSTGTSAAIVVRDASLLFLSQLLPVNPQRQLVAPDATGQAEFLCHALRDALGDEARHRVVRLNIMTDCDESAAAVLTVLARQVEFTGGPVVTFASGRPLIPGVKVSLEAVVARPQVARGIERTRNLELAPLRQLTAVAGAQVAREVSPGPLWFVAGQAEAGTTIAEATRKTMESLQRTLAWRQMTFRDVVAIRSFLSPMDQAGTAGEVIAEFCDAPQTLLEWNSPGSIEIELIAARPAAQQPANLPVEYLTPPGMNASPVFSRVASSAGPTLIFVSGLTGEPGSDATGQVTEIFTRLEGLVGRAGGNLKHLVKATYFVSTDAASQSLNVQRPKYYDPARPPSASKAPVTGVGLPGRQLTVDMIAVPAP
ncbi:MAG: hypothetical protein ACKOJF_02990 [Planctomycetaceae bacterium]